jgi:hypothetical protein
MSRLRALAHWAPRAAVSAAVCAYISCDVDHADLRATLSAVHVQQPGAAAGPLYLAGQVLNAVKWWLLGSSVGLVRPLMDYTRFYFGGGGWTTRRVKRRGWGCGSRSTAA